MEEFSYPMFFGKKKIVESWYGHRLIFRIIPPPEPILSNLICWLDGRDGVHQMTTWADRSGLGNDFSLVNFTFDENSHWTGTGVKFDGVSTFCENKTGISINVRNYTLSIRFKDMIISEEVFKGYIGLDNSINSKIGLRRDLNRLKKYPEQSIGSITDIDSILNKVTSLDISVKDGQCSIYLDNVLIKSFRHDTTVTSNTNAVIGCPYVDWLDNFKDFTCYAVKIYNRPLTVEEIQHNHSYEMGIKREVVSSVHSPKYDGEYIIGSVDDLKGLETTHRKSADGKLFISHISNIQEDVNIISRHSHKEISEIINKDEWRAPRHLR
ncbi:MAG: hypothetical protein ACRC5T_09055 [Cetobacterium sp.]